jgi:hypothetical protein
MVHLPLIFVVLALCLFGLAAFLTPEIHRLRLMAGGLCSYMLSLLFGAFIK